MELISSTLSGTTVYKDIYCDINNEKDNKEGQMIDDGSVSTLVGVA